MLHLPPDKNKLLKGDAQSARAHTAEYDIVNRNVYGILDQICKDAHLYPYVKQYKSKRDGRRASYAILSRWLSLNHVNVTASEAKMALHMSTYDGKKAWNWEKYVACHVKYHIILGNLMHYGYQGLDPGLKV